MVVLCAARAHLTAQASTAAASSPPSRPAGSDAAKPTAEAGAPAAAGVGVLGVSDFCNEVGEEHFWFGSPELVSPRLDLLTVRYGVMCGHSYPLGLCAVTAARWPVCIRCVDGLPGPIHPHIRYGGILLLAHRTPTTHSHQRAVAAGDGSAGSLSIKMHQAARCEVRTAAHINDIHPRSICLTLLSQVPA